MALETTDTFATRVVFRRYRDGDIIALLVDAPANPGSVMCYQHIGQHGEGFYPGIMADTKPAKPAEYAPLRRELESMGYQLTIQSRRNP